MPTDIQHEQGHGSPKVLITGASGFIGSYLVSEALHRGWETHAAVRASSSRRYLQDPAIRFVQMDMLDPDGLQQRLARHAAEHGSFDFVIHNAGVTKPRSPEEFEEGNALFTARFARMLLETQPQLSRFVYMSSIGALGPGNSHSLAPIREDQSPKPLTPYARSKLLAEQLLAEIDGIPRVVLRPSAVYGARDVKFLERILGMLKRGVEVRLGPRKQALSFIHAYDLAWVAAEACIAPVTGHAFNLSDGNHYNQCQFNTIVKEVLGGKTVAMRIPVGVLMAIGYTSFHVNRLLRRPVHLSHFKMREITARNWNVDITKARELLNFEPRFPLREGIEDAVQWYRANA